MMLGASSLFKGGFLRGEESYPQKPFNRMVLVMILPKFIEYLNSIRDDKGVPLNYGCTVSDIEKYKRQLERQRPERPFYVVSDWMWLSLRIDEVFPEDYDEAVYYHCICAATILEGGANRRFKGILTGKLVASSHSCIVQTVRENYILVGTGYRVPVEGEKLMLALRDRE